MLVINVLRFPQAALVAVLGALEALYVPLESKQTKSAKVHKLGVFGNFPHLDLVKALEAGRIVSRDIGGSDPETMAAPKVEEYLKKNLNSNVKIEVIQGQQNFQKDYPCFAAVNRSADQVERHQGRIIWLTYEPEVNLCEMCHFMN